jgi:hypothetical protein
VHVTTGIESVRYDYACSSIKGTASLCVTMLSLLRHRVHSVGRPAAVRTRIRACALLVMSTHRLSVDSK